MKVRACMNSLAYKPKIIQIVEIKANISGNKENVVVKRAIFQTFWKDDCCTKSLFFKLETSNCVYLLIFLFSLTVQSFSKIGQH